MNREELIKKINSLELVQEECWEDIEFPQEIQEILDSCQIVGTELDIDRHRWYETSITVYQFSIDEYIGIRYVTNIYSESSSIEDMYWRIIAFPMKATETVTYYIQE